MAIAAFFDLAFPATLPGGAMDRPGAVRSGPPMLYGRSPFAHAIRVQPHGGGRRPFAATSELCDGLSDPSIEADAVVYEGLPLDCVCDSGYGIAPGTAVDEGTATGAACTPAPRARSKRKTEDGRRKER